MKITYDCGHTIDHSNITSVEPYMNLEFCNKCRKAKNSAAIASEIVYACGHKISQPGGTGPIAQRVKLCKECWMKQSRQNYLNSLRLKGKKVATAIYACGCTVEIVLKKDAPNTVNRSGACPAHNRAFNRLGGIGDYCHQDDNRSDDSDEE